MVSRSAVSRSTVSRSTVSRSAPAMSPTGSGDGQQDDVVAMLTVVPRAPGRGAQVGLYVAGASRTVIVYQDAVVEVWARSSVSASLVRRHTSIATQRAQRVAPKRAGAPAPLNLGHMQDHRPRAPLGHAVERPGTILADAVWGTRANAEPGARRSARHTARSHSSAVSRWYAETSVGGNADAWVRICARSGETLRTGRDLR
jgi:hypothetical protein